MTREELKQVAIECLAKAFKGDSSIPAHVVQSATAIVLTPASETSTGLRSAA